MNLLEKQEDATTNATHMCIAGNCQQAKFFKKEDEVLHESHKRDYFDIDKTISKIQNSYQNLIKFKEEEKAALKKLQVEVKKKEQDIEDLDGTINNTQILTKHLKLRSYVQIKQNVDLLNKIRFDQFDLDQSNLHETRLTLTTLSLQNSLIESAPLFVYPDFKAVYKNLPLNEFTNCQILCQNHENQKKSQSNQNQNDQNQNDQNKQDPHQNQTVGYLLLDQYLELGLRAVCANCKGMKYSLEKSKQFMNEVINQEITLEKMITLAGNVKKFRNKILKTLKYLINCLDVEIKNVSQKLMERQKNFNRMMPQGQQFSLGNYQYIAEMLAENIQSDKYQIKNYFNQQGIYSKIDDISKFIKDISTNYSSMTENDNYQRFFSEQEDKLRLTLEIVRKSDDDQAKIFKGYEILVQRDQELKVLINWIKNKENKSIDSVVKISHNYCIFDFDQNRKWRDYNIKNGAIIHVIFE